MYNLTIKVPDAKSLADTLTRLHQAGITTVEARWVPSDPQRAADASHQPAVISGGRRPYRKSAQSSHDKATDILMAMPDTPFRPSEYARACKAKGISNGVAYRAIRMAVDSGKLNKLGPGLYQLGSGWSSLPTTTGSDLNGERAPASA